MDKFDRAIALLPDIAKGLDALPPKRAMQRGVFWGVLILALLQIILTSYYLQHIQSDLHGRIIAVLPDDAVVGNFVELNGRAVTLRGTVEPGQVAAENIQRITQVKGISKLVNVLIEEPKPAPEFHLSLRSEQLNLEGKLSGTDLESVAVAVGRAFPYHAIRDRIQIDDRLGQPRWIDHLDSGLATLSILDNYEFYGWHDAVMISGVARSQKALDRFHYTLPLHLRDGVQVDQQLRVQNDPKIENISLVSGWNGTALSAVVSTVETAELVEAQQRHFGHQLDLASDQGEQNTARVVVNEQMTVDHHLPALLTLFPAFAKVQDLRLVKNGEGYKLWGRVDTSIQLGGLVTAIEQAGLTLIIDNQVYIDPGTNIAEISIFREAKKVIVSGRLPSEISRIKLIEAIKNSLGAHQVESFINIEPNIYQSSWLEDWDKLFSILPKTIFGLTVSEGGVLISGDVADEASRQFIGQALTTVFGDMVTINWLTVALDS